MTHIITAIDITGRRWFRNARHQWQANRDNHCHFPNAIEASKIYHDAIVANRFLDPEDRMDDIEMVQLRSEEHTSELQSLMRISYAVFCLKKKNTTQKYK